VVTDKVDELLAGLGETLTITATRLEKERDRIAVTPPQQLDPVKEMALLDDLVLTETQGFFQRLFGSGGPSKSSSSAP
jgi:hypothetical protein